MTVDHPARFSDTIVDEMRALLLERYPSPWGRPIVFDPFAGTGERLAEMCERPTWEESFAFGGLEIEESFIVDYRIVHGNAVVESFYPREPFVIATSPAYGANGISDSWSAKDASKRRNYRKSVAKNEGADRQLHHDNMGRLGYRGSKYYPPVEAMSKNTKRGHYWRLAHDAASVWWKNQACEAVFVNASDSMHSNGQVEPHVADWKLMLEHCGWKITNEHPVVTPRFRHGENGDQRVEHEVILVGSR